MENNPPVLEEVHEVDIVQLLATNTKALQALAANTEALQAIRDGQQQKQQNQT